jgi:hypothetical protein
MKITDLTEAQQAWVAKMQTEYGMPLDIAIQYLYYNS